MLLVLLALLALMKPLLVLLVLLVLLLLLLLFRMLSVLQVHALVALHSLASGGTVLHAADPCATKQVCRRCCRPDGMCSGAKPGTCREHNQGACTAVDPGCWNVLYCCSGCKQCLRFRTWIQPVLHK